MMDEYECTICGFIFDEFGECPECGAFSDDVIPHEQAEENRAINRLHEILEDMRHFREIEA